MLLHQSTWHEVEEYLSRSSGIIIPTGSIEQHGPNGLIGTDSICSEVIARDIGDRFNVLIGPTITLGVAQFNLGFPGSVSVRPTTLIALIEDYVRSLVRSGFDHFYFLNGHGGNLAPARAAFQEIYTEASLRQTADEKPIRCRIRSWWELPETNSLRHELFGEWEGVHATPSEVAITQHVYPEAIKVRDMSEPEQVDEAYLRDHPSDDHFDAHHHRERFPDGRIGSDPSLASPDAGKRLIDCAVEELGEDFRAFLAES